MIETVSILALVLAPLATYMPVRGKVESPVLWAVAGLGVHLLVGNVLNRWVMPRIWPMPSGTVGLPGSGEYSAGSLAEYEAGIGWLEQSTTVSLAIGVLSAFLFGVLIRTLARSPASDGVDTVRQLVDETCAVCGRSVGLPGRRSGVPIVTPLCTSSAWTRTTASSPRRPVDVL